MKLYNHGEGPSRGLLRDCTTSPINQFAALILDERLYFPYDLFMTEKDGPNLFNLINGRIGTSDNFAGR